MHNILCQKLQISPLYVLVARRIDTFWSAVINPFWSEDIETFWVQKIMKEKLTKFASLHT